MILVSCILPSLVQNYFNLRALLYAFFLRLVSFLIVVFAQGFVKVALDCLDGRFLLMILSIPCFS